VDWAGHTENQHFFTLKLDGSAPTTTISTSGTNGWNGWKTSPVQVTLSPSDSRSGVAATYYTVDGGPTQTYSGPFMINESAAHQVNYWSVDNVGNAETQKSAPVNIDKDAPVTESSVSGPAGNNNYYKGAVQVSLTATDSVSGLGALPTSYQIDSGTTMSYSGSPFTVSGDGPHTVKFWSTDFAGNTASPSTITLNIDATAPATQAALAGGHGPAREQLHLLTMQALNQAYFEVREAEAQAFAQKLTQGPVFAHMMTKTMLGQEWSMSIDQAIEAEAQAQAICMQTADFRRAYEAFIAKGTPRFAGN
jgi:hypothetical protein